MKYSLRTLIFAMFVSAIIAGWFADRQGLIYRAGVVEAMHLKQQTSWEEHQLRLENKIRVLSASRQRYRCAISETFFRSWWSLLRLSPGDYNRLGYWFKVVDAFWQFLSEPLENQERPVQD